MSFILDALRKSEAERQQQSGGEFSNVPTGSEAPRSTVWLWLLGGLLGINLAVLLGILLRPDVQAVRGSTTTPEAGVPAPETPPPSAIPDAMPSPARQGEQGFADRVASVRADRESDAPAAVPGAAAVAANTEFPDVVPDPAPSVSEQLPGIDELRLDGSLQLPDLHVDIHVYSDDPAERFVFINMAKHREGSTLAEGPAVRSITADGVVLEYRGRRFLLPRE